VGGKRVVTGVRNTVTGNSPSIARHSVTVTEIVASEVMTAAAHGVAAKYMSMEGVREAVSARCMATPPMTNATIGEPASMSATTPTAMPTTTPTAMPATTTRPATTPMPAAASTTPAGDCRSVRDDAKRANRNARCQNTYCFLLHGAFPISQSKTSCGAMLASSLNRI
jgi:hypothetical protein